MPPPPPPPPVLRQQLQPQTQTRTARGHTPIKGRNGTGSDTSSGGPPPRPPDISAIHAEGGPPHRTPGEPFSTPGEPFSTPSTARAEGGVDASASHALLDDLSLSVSAVHVGEAAAFVDDKRPWAGATVAQVRPFGPPGNAAAAPALAHIQARQHLLFAQVDRLACLEMRNDSRVWTGPLTSVAITLPSFSAFSLGHPATPRERAPPGAGGAGSGAAPGRGGGGTAAGGSRGE